MRSARRRPGSRPDCRSRNSGTFDSPVLMRRSPVRAPRRESAFRARPTSGTDPGSACRKSSSGKNSVETRSPTEKRVTASPTASITPQPSENGVSGRGVPRPYTPFQHQQVAVVQRDRAHAHEHLMRSRLGIWQFDHLEVVQTQVASVSCRARIVTSPFQGVGGRTYRGGRRSDISLVQLRRFPGPSAATSPRALRPQHGRLINARAQAWRSRCIEGAPGQVRRPRAIGWRGGAGEADSRMAAVLPHARRRCRARLPARTRIRHHRHHAPTGPPR